MLNPTLKPCREVLCVVGLFLSAWASELTYSLPLRPIALHTSCHSHRSTRSTSQQHHGLIVLCDPPAPSQRCTSPACPSSMPFALNCDPEKTWHWQTDDPAAVCSLPPAPRSSEPARLNPLAHNGKESRPPLLTLLSFFSIRRNLLTSTSLVFRSLAFD